MDEKTFFDYIDKKFEAVAGLLGSIIDQLEDVKEIVQIKSVVTATLADFSKEPKADSRYAKKMPLQVGEWIIAKKGCNRCGGKITWDNYNETDHKYPDHVDEEGNLLDNCPAYQP